MDKRPFQHKKGTPSFLREFPVSVFKRDEIPLLLSVLNSNGHGDGSANHGVVAHADQAHHLNVRRHGRGTGELSVAMHTAQGVGHAVGGGAGSHVVGMQGTARAAAGSDGEVLLAVHKALLFVSAGDRMLEAGGVGGVAGDGNVHALQMHDGHALADIVSAVAADVCALALGVTNLSLRYRGL